MSMTISNYNDLSPLPVDMVTGKIIPFGAEVVQYNDDSLSLAEGITPSWSVSDPFTLSIEWWNKRVELDRNTFAYAAEYLAWEYEQENSGYLYHAPEFEFTQFTGKEIYSGTQSAL